MSQEKPAMTSQALNQSNVRLDSIDVAMTAIEATGRAPQDGSETRHVEATAATEPAAESPNDELDPSTRPPVSASESRRKRRSSLMSLTDGHMTHELLCKYLDTLEQLEQQLGANTRLVFRRNQIIKVLEGATMEYAQNLAEVYYFERFIAERDHKNVVVKRDEAEKRAKQSLVAAKSYRTHVDKLCRELADIKYNIALSFRSIELKRAEVRQWWHKIPRDVLSIEQHELYLKHLSDSFQSDFVSRLSALSSSRSGEGSSTVADALTSAASTTAAADASKRASLETLGTTRSLSTDSISPRSTVPITQPSPRIRRSSISLGVVLGIEEDQKRQFSVESPEHVASRVEMESGTFEMPMLKKLRDIAGITPDDLPTFVSSNTQEALPAPTPTSEPKRSPLVVEAPVIPSDSDTTTATALHVPRPVRSSLPPLSPRLPPSVSPRPYQSQPSPRSTTDRCDVDSTLSTKALKPFYSPTVLRQVVTIQSSSSSPSSSPSLTIPRLNLENLHQTSV